MGKNLKGEEIGKGISQRKDGRYEARAVINGTKVHIYNMNLATLKKDFEQKKAEILTQKESEVVYDITLNQYFEYWFPKIKAPQLKNEASRKSTERKLRNTFCKYLGEKYLYTITQADIQETANKLLGNGISDSSIKHGIGLLKELMDIAVLNSVIKVNPCVSIKVKNSNIQKERRVLSKWEQEVFLDEVNNSYYYEVYMFLLLTGVRIGEFSALTWNDIDFNKCEITINKSMSTAYINGKKIEEITTPKTANSYRTIPFFGDIAKHLKTWKTKQDMYKLKLQNRWRSDPEYGDLVFTTTMGSPVTRYVLMHDLQKVMSNINLKLAYNKSTAGLRIDGIHPHCFRHTFATRCFEKNLSPVFVQAIMGHSNYNTTLSYTHLQDEIIKLEAQKGSNLLG